MDYIREELLRQQAVLAELMQGGETKKAAKPTEETDDDAVVSAGRTAFPQSAGMRGAGSTESADMAGSAMPGARRGVGELPQPEGMRLRREVLSEMETGTFRRNGEAAAANAAEADARRVSRAIQRDARRYDGGFSIY